jgi:LDH2 family malate/lactate/ureidoglycolate dehydrogenase
MTDQAVRVPVDKVTDFMRASLAAMGVPAGDVDTITDVLITSDLWGIPSHGIAHLKMYHERIKAGLQLPVTSLTTVRETDTTAVLDGGNGMGMVIGHRAMQLAIEKARHHGLGAVAVRNSSHYGIAGYYARMAVLEGMVGLSMTNAHPSTAPTFGVQPMMGTNPIAVGAPSDEPFPFLFDASTSVVTRGKIEVAARAKKPIPPGWAIGQDGKAVTDSTTLIESMNRDAAALLPVGGLGELLGGHKGYGLAAIVEIFSAAFQQGAFLSELHDTDSEGRPHFLRIGHFFLAIDVERFLPLETFRHTVGDILRELRASTKAPGAGHIYTAGEKAHAHTQRVLAEGVEIAPGVQRALRTLRDELGLQALELGLG